MVTRDKLIFPSAITWILCHFFVPIPNSPYYIVMGAINAGFVRQSEAQLWPKWPRTETTDSAAPVVPSASAPSSSNGGVTLKAIMAQLQCMDARLNTFNDELCQVNTRVSCIAWQQACLGGFTASPSPFPKVSADKDGEDIDDGDDANTSSFSNDEMTTSRWLTLCHSWQKGRVVLGWE